MKKITSIKTRITIWYTALMLVLISILLIIIGTFSYRLSMESIETNLQKQVNEISQRIMGRHTDEIFYNVESKKEFRNVSICDINGEYIVGQYLYDLTDIPFKEFAPHREMVDGKEYIVYDVFRPARPGETGGYWIRGAEPVGLSKIFSRSFFMIILFIAPIILLLTALGGYYITKKAFLPVNNIVRTADEIYSDNDIKKRVPIDPNAHEDELQNLSRTINRMLDKIEGLIISEKQFTSDASHELRTPVSVILAQGEYLLELAETEKQRELATDIVAKAKQASKLISRLLVLARIDQSRQSFKREKIDINAVADIVVQDMEELAAQKNISILTSIEDNIMLYADEALITSAVSNLVSNAIKYGKESGYVMISASKYNGNVEIKVKDNGVGISKEGLEKIWTRFYREDEARNDEYGSYGLGLPMAKSIVELHGGKIEAKSVLGEGSEFIITMKI